MPIIDPQVKIQDLLIANWIPANTSNITPKIHTGWFNTAWTKTPQITVTNPEHRPFKGGDTGVTAFKGSGGLVTITHVDMIVAPWAHEQMVDSNGATFDSLGINPKALIYEMSNEIKRIIRANRVSDPELDFMAHRGMTPVVDTRVKPVVFRYNHDVRLSYTETY